MSRSVVLWVGLVLGTYALAIPTNRDFQSASLPLTCAELLPDTTPYLLFFEAVGRGQVATNRTFSKRIYRILSLRERMVDVVEKGRDQNPIDSLVRKTLCFYREQKEPLKPVPFDDTAFLSFLKVSMKDLETKVDEAVYEWELERQQRKEFERMALRNQKKVDSLVREADVEADRVFEKLSQRAKRKVKTQ